MLSIRSHIAWFAVLVLAGLGTGITSGQTVVQPMPIPQQGFDVNGEAYMPFGGWQWIGDPTASNGPEAYQVNRSVAKADLAELRAHRVNFVWEHSAADGRIVARKVQRDGSDWWNGINYVIRDQEKVWGPKPGAFVEGMKWLIRNAHHGNAAPYEASPSPPERPIYTMISVQGFVRPFATAAPDLPDGYEEISCPMFRGLIQDEIRAHEARREDSSFTFIPPVDCSASAVPPDGTPYWKWNLWYVVHNLRGENGLFAWFLWDEPEDGSYKPIFGGRPENEQYGTTWQKGRPRSWDPDARAPQPPTPDLLRYAYKQVKTFETQGNALPHHPVVVEVYTPQAFISWNRTDWLEGSPDANFEKNKAGPFSIRPDGSYDVPCDIFGIDASGAFKHTAASGDKKVGYHPPYWDQNAASQRGSAMAMKIVEEYDLWGAMQLAQSQFPPGIRQGGAPQPGGYADYHREAGAFQLRGEATNNERSRHLNDRDILWQALTPLIDGARGLYYYALSLTPADVAPQTPGAEQVRRLNRLADLFHESGLADVFLDNPVPEGDGWRIHRVRVNQLTNYYRSDHPRRGEVSDTCYAVSPVPLDCPVGRTRVMADPGVSYYDSTCELCRRPLHPEQYNWKNFGREISQTIKDPSQKPPSGYGHAANNPEEAKHREFRSYQLLRRTVFQRDDAAYLFLSNAYDARIVVQVVFEVHRSQPAVETAAFNLGASPSFRWTTPDVENVSLELEQGRLVATIQMAPYQAQAFRIR